MNKDLIISKLIDRIGESKIVLTSIIPDLKDHSIGKVFVENEIKYIKTLESELSLLQEKEDIDTPLKNMTKNAFTMTDKIEEQGEEEELPSWNGNFTPSEIYKSERSGKELREKLTVRKFMLKKYPTNVYMDCPVPKEYWEVIQEYANEYLKSNQ